jgi:hypothetical protein
MWKRALAIVVAGSVLQFGSCLSWWGQALIYGSGWTVGATITNELGIAGMITDLVPE